MNTIISENYVRIDDDIMGIASKVLNINQKYLSIEKNLSEFNLNSLAITEMVRLINNLYDINISPANIYGHKTISSFIEFLVKTHECKIMDYYNSIIPQLPLENKIRETSQEQLNELRIDRKHLILLSAKNNKTLNNYIKRLLSFLEKNLNNSLLLEDIEYFLISKHPAKKERLAIIVDDLEELFQKLTDFIAVKKNISNVYYNETKQDNNQIKLFLLSPDAKQLTLKWINNNEAKKLALLWLNGIPIEWEDIFKKHKDSISHNEKKILEQCFYTDIYPDLIPSTLKYINFSVAGALDKKKIAQDFATIDQLGVKLILCLFRQKNIFINVKNYESFEQIKEKMGVTSRFDRLLRAFINILSSEQVVIEKDNLYSLNPNYIPLSIEAVEKEKEIFLAQNQNYAAHFRLLWKCYENTIDIMRETITAVEVVFPKMSMDLVEPIYKNNYLADYFNLVTCEFVVAYINSRLSMLKSGEKITILEVGAGTGGTSTSLFNFLKPFGDYVHYIYTDISTGFVQFGKKTYGEQLPNMSFMPLNLENDIEQQGFENGQVDLIVGANVVHATSNIECSLLNMKRLLKRNGLVILNELVDFQIYSTLTFGLLDGWWLYNDEDKRIPHSPLLSFIQWTNIFIKTGFPNVISLNKKCQEESLIFQDIIVAESDGLII